MTDGDRSRIPHSDRRTPAHKDPAQASRLSLWRGFLVVVWTGAVVASLSWNLHLNRQGLVAQARAQAAVLLERDLAARDLVAGLGGVYAGAGEGAAPDADLHPLRERDVTTDPVVALTLPNASYFMRLLHGGESPHLSGGAAVHVASLRPLSPDHRPDGWEQRALLRFQRGVDEVGEAVTAGAEPRYRLMRPRHVEQGCLVCHGGQGLQVGEVLGGVSVSVPVGEPGGAWPPGREAALTLGHGFLWLLGMAGLVTGFGMLERRDGELRQSAYFDPLTQLPNRRLLRDRLQQALANAERHDHMGAVLLIDLDRFKTINDSLGPAMGDALLQAVAVCLRNTLRATDTVARVGGDEFVVLLAELPAAAERAAVNAQAVAEKVLAAIDRPFRVGHHELRTTAGVGIALFPMSVSGADEVLKQADTALYRAKGAGSGEFHFYLPGMQLAATRRLEIETDLHYALGRGELMLHFQPQVEIGSNRIIGAEALLRWRHPRRGMVSPGDFVPVAEETGIIVAVGDWVLREACRSIRRWSEEGIIGPGFRLAVNVSPKQFRQWDFVERAATIIADSGVDARFLELELTEGVLVHDVEDAAFKMECLIELGIRFAIDDFGTGYSSLMYLKRLPVEVLKIDRSFVDGILSDINDATIVETILAMAQRFGHHVIAEGVEQEGQLNFLRTHGCDAYQGYHFSKPLGAAEFVTLTRRQPRGA